MSKRKHSARRPRGGKHPGVFEKPRAAKKTAGPKGGGRSRRRPEAACCFMPGCWELEVSLVAQTVKNLPAMQETWVQSLDQEDPLEKGMATHFSILAWRIPWTEQATAHRVTKKRTC